MKLINGSIGLAFAIVFSQATLAATIDATADKALEAFQKGHFQVALAKWIPFAEQGNASAQSNLGFMYERGHGVTQNYETAANWYALAAEQGDAAAQSNLGGMYDLGKGVPEDDKTAVKWLMLAAGQGHAAAQTYLGVMYINGEGVPTDYLRAFMWWSIGANHGDKLSTQYKQSITKKLTPAHRVKAQAMADRCLASSYSHC